MERRMSQKEVQIIMTTITMLLIIGWYVWYVYKKFVAGNPEIINDFQFWGKQFLIFIPIMVGTMIAFFIVFAIIKKAVTDEDLDTKSDEMDKLIELKAMRIAHWMYALGFIFAMGSQAIGMQPWVLFVTLISSCFLSGLVEAMVKIYYYRKGV